MKAGRSRNIPAFAAPALVAGARGAVWLGADGVVEALDHAAAVERAQAGPPPVVCHAPATARKLKGPPFAVLDALELFAFVRPAVFCLPTPRGLAAVLGLADPKGLKAEAETLRAAARTLLAELGEADESERAAAVA
ncbi:MAG: ATP-dependent DNA helicase, partial [Proteobacteria bacterium]|nr:ATP-dependent DNA helicase [Pseudomonadota bacterium]